MKIRSITAFASLDQKDYPAQIAALAPAVQAAQQQLEAADYAVQSTRLATQSFSQLIAGLDAAETLALAQAIEARALEAGFGYISLGPVAADDSASLAQVAPVLGGTEASFLSVQLAGPDDALDPRRLAASAEVIQQVSVLQPNGFANLKLAALANVAPGSPFFPAAYHANDPPAFAFGPQAADLAVQAFSDISNIQAASQALTAAIESHSRILEEVGVQIEARQGLDFLGTDFSLAPYPKDRESLGKAIELMGVPQVGLQGSLTTAAVLTSAIQAAKFKRTGFNGLLLPPLEDSVLAQRAAEGLLSVNDLLMLSAVCGTGLDTIPLPGDIPTDALAAILMDLTALALRLDKPLTARLMPIPGKRAGDETDFEFEFFANSRVLAADEAGLKPPLSQSPPFTIRKR